MSVGTGTTITGSGLTGRITSVSWDGVTRESVDNTAMDNVSWKSFIPADLVDPGTLQVEGFFDSGTPVFGAAGAIVVTFPGGGTWSSSGFMTDFSVSDPLEDQMTFSATFKITGAIAVA